MRLNRVVELVLLAIVWFSIALPLSLAAQTPERFEVFGGYSYTTFSIFDRYSGPWQRFGYNGWEAAVAATLVPHLAVEGDFAGLTQTATPVLFEPLWAARASSEISAKLRFTPTRWSGK